MFNGAADHSKHMKRLMESRKLIGSSDGTTNKLSIGNTAFDKKVNSNFAKRIEDERKRKHGLKAVGGTSGASTDSDLAQPDLSSGPASMSKNDDATGVDVEAKVAAKEAPPLSNSTTSNAVDSKESNLAKEAKPSVSADI